MPESLIAIWEALPYLLQGSGVTLVVICGSMALGLVLGVPWRSARSTAIRGFAA
jgi:polar amino acid transport system permease protein